MPSRSISESGEDESKRAGPMRTLSDGNSSWRGAWTKAALKAKDAEDPWKKFDMPNTCETERARRYRYNALEKKWAEDLIHIKVQKQPFAKGAMRECFRLKKLSNFSKSTDWSHAANYVAKSYLEAVPNKTYFDDVRLQMDAKVWGEEFNRKNPPKKVDIFQMYVIALVDRENHPYYHLEHFIEGNYVKYNSNSGFVLTDHMSRHTPQAFSHFTFERSGHQLIVVDVQGVGDLYTDPQIHTHCGTDYGEANLGVQGMALFFSSHRCNEICEALGLAQFDLSELEHERIDSLSAMASDHSTHVRSTSRNERKVSAYLGLVERLSSPSPSCEFESSHGSLSSINSSASECESASPVAIERPRLHSDHEDFTSLPSTPEMDSSMSKFFGRHGSFRKSSVMVRPVSKDELQVRLQALQEEEEIIHSTLGEVHLSMAKYNTLGRFTQNVPDYDSAMFHFIQASHCGNVIANRTLGQIHLQLPHEMLEEYTIEESDVDTRKGLHYITLAALGGDRDAMLIAAKAYDTGNGLPSESERCWTEALRFYNMVLDHQVAGDNTLNEDPDYKITERLAEMFKSGGFELEKDLNRAGELYNSAAELAMNSMKGKLANRYYMLAEEAWGEMEE